MAYDEKFKKRTLEYCHEGHTLAQTREAFKISLTTIYKWKNQLKEEGNLKNIPQIVRSRKLILKIR